MLWQEIQPAARWLVCRGLGWPAGHENYELCLQHLERVLCSAATFSSMGVQPIAAALTDATEAASFQRGPDGAHALRKLSQQLLSRQTPATASTCAAVLAVLLDQAGCAPRGADTATDAESCSSASTASTLMPVDALAISHDSDYEAWLAELQASDGDSTASVSCARSCASPTACASLHVSPPTLPPLDIRCVVPDLLDQAARAQQGTRLEPTGLLNTASVAALADAWACMAGAGTGAMFTKHARTLRVRACPAAGDPEVYSSHEPQQTGTEHQQHMLAARAGEPGALLEPLDAATRANIWFEPVCAACNALTSLAVSVRLPKSFSPAVLNSQPLPALAAVQWVHAWLQQQRETAVAQWRAWAGQSQQLGMAPRGAIPEVLHFAGQVSRMCATLAQVVRVAQAALQAWQQEYTAASAQAEPSAAEHEQGMERSTRQPGSPGSEQTHQLVQLLAHASQFHPRASYGLLSFDSAACEVHAELAALAQAFSVAEDGPAPSAAAPSPNSEELLAVVTQTSELHSLYVTVLCSYVAAAATWMDPRHVREPLPAWRVTWVEAGHQAAQALRSGAACKYVQWYDVGPGAWSAVPVPDACKSMAHSVWRAGCTLRQITALQASAIAGADDVLAGIALADALLEMMPTVPVEQQLRSLLWHGSARQGDPALSDDEQADEQADELVQQCAELEALLLHGEDRVGQASSPAAAGHTGAPLSWAIPAARGHALAHAVRAVLMPRVHAVERYMLVLTFMDHDGFGMLRAAQAMWYQAGPGIHVPYFEAEFRAWLEDKPRPPGAQRGRALTAALRRAIDFAQAGPDDRGMVLPAVEPLHTGVHALQAALAGSAWLVTRAAFAVEAAARVSVHDVPAHAWRAAGQDTSPESSAASPAGALYMSAVLRQMCPRVLLEQLPCAWLFPEPVTQGCEQIWHALALCQWHSWAAVHVRKRACDALDHAAHPSLEGQRSQLIRQVSVLAWHARAVLAPYMTAIAVGVQMPEHSEDEDVHAHVLRAVQLAHEGQQQFSSVWLDIAQQAESFPQLTPAALAALQSGAEHAQDAAIASAGSSTAASLPGIARDSPSALFVRVASAPNIQTAIRAHAQHVCGSVCGVLDMPSPALLSAACVDNATISALQALLLPLRTAVKGVFDAADSVWWSLRQFASMVEHGSRGECMLQLGAARTALRTLQAQAAHTARVLSSVVQAGHVGLPGARAAQCALAMQA